MRRHAGGFARTWCQSICACLIGFVLASTALRETARIKRISLMTRDLDRSVAFFTEVVGFGLDFEGTLPANGEPFLGPVFNIDASQPIRRAIRHGDSSNGAVASVSCNELRQFFGEIMIDLSRVGGFPIIRDRCRCSSVGRAAHS